MSEEFERLRLLASDPTPASDRETGARPFAGRVTSTGTNLAVGKFVKMQPFQIFGHEAEGATPSFTDSGPEQLVAWLGPATPVNGDRAIAKWSGHRWVARKRSPAGSTGGPVDIPGCACQNTPGTLHMSATGPCGDGTFPGATFVYGPTPPEFSGLDLGANCYLSAETYTDAYSGGSYRFHLGCDTIFFRLSRVYMADETSGSFAFHDATIYAWSIGQPGNTCSPFLLSTGTIYSGGNPACIVVVTE